MQSSPVTGLEAGPQSSIQNHQGSIPHSSPLDGSELPDVQPSEQLDISKAIETARIAQQRWASRSVKERARVLARAGRHLLGCADELAQLLHSELGKPMADAYAVDLGSASEVFRYYTRQAEKLLASERVAFNRVMFPQKRATLDRVPHGVVALITPWNYPVSIPLHNLVPALLAGNAVVMKPSEYAARTGAKLVEILNAELPPGLLGLVQGDAVVGEQLICGGVDFVVFVGGTAGGRAVARTAAEKLIPVSLELGGKDAAIVLEDADLERAAHGIAWAGFVNAGQSCAAVERVYVVEAVAEAFSAKLVALAQKLRMGDDANAPGSIEIGPLVTERQLAIVENQVEQALQSGAKLLCGGKRHEPGRFYEPTVLTNVNSSMQIMQTETFGPVIPIQIVPDEAAALREANATPYGLTGSVWTSDLDRGERLARQLLVGVATVNNHMFSGAAPQAAWAGRGFSGYGVQNSKLAIQALTRPRLVAVDAHRTRRELWWFPYDRALFDLGQGMMAFLGDTKSPRRRLAAFIQMTRGVLGRMNDER